VPLTVCSQRGVAFPQRVATFRRANIKGAVGTVAVPTLVSCSSVGTQNVSCQGISDHELWNIYSYTWSSGKGLRAS
jgi:hypothetical protein